MSIFIKNIYISIISIVVLLVICSFSLPRHIIPASTAVDPLFSLVIDAGHGGEDGGAVSASGVRESNLNLSIALKAESLAALLGLEPIMIRNADISIYDEGCKSISEKKSSDLRNRVRVVESLAHPILLSIHQNHFSDGKYRGAQVFFSNYPGSNVWAEKIQSDFRLLDKTNKRQIKLANNIYLMEQVNCPAVLVECGFLSNSAETMLLQESNYQKKLAMTMLRAVVSQGKEVSEEREV